MDAFWESKDIRKSQIDFPIYPDDNADLWLGESMDRKEQLPLIFSTASVQEIRRKLRPRMNW